MQRFGSHGGRKYKYEYLDKKKPKKKYCNCTEEGWRLAREVHGELGETGAPGTIKIVVGDDGKGRPSVIGWLYLDNRIVERWL